MCAVNPLILTFRNPSEEQVAAFPQSRAHHSQQDSATDPGLRDSLATGSFLNGHHHHTAAKSPKCEIERPRQKLKGSWRKNKEEERIEVKKTSNISRDRRKDATSIKYKHRKETIREKFSENTNRTAKIL